MTFSITDRLILLRILPKQGDIITLKIVRDLQEAASFSEEEIEAYGLKDQGSRITWTPGADGTKEIPLGPKAHDVIRTALEALNKQKALDLGLVAFYDRLCGDEAELR